MFLNIEIKDLKVFYFDVFVWSECSFFRNFDIVNP